jgi:hypothetical protein
MTDYTLQQAQQDIASLRGQLAHFLAQAEVINLTVDGTLLAQNPVAIVQPGSSPAVAETWHDLPAGLASWGIGTGGWKKYRLTNDGDVEVSISLRLIGTKTDGTTIFAAGAFPTGYQTGGTVGARKLLPLSMDTSAATFYGANHTPYMSFNTDGSVTIFGVNATGLSVVDCHGIIPLI